MPKLQANLLARLKNYQDKKKISIKTLAKQLGVSNVTLCQWLEKHRKLRPRECQAVESFLDRNKA